MIRSKYRVTVLLATAMASFIVLPSFVGREKKGREQKIGYQFPAAMSDVVQAQFRAECDKGQALYNLVCANCHDKKVEGKRIVPDWSTTQLVGYELRVLNPKHEAGIPEEQVSAEELGYIMTFLAYKKKNAVLSVQ